MLTCFTALRFSLRLSSQQLGVRLNIAPRLASFHCGTAPLLSQAWWRLLVRRWQSGSLILPRASRRSQSASKFNTRDDRLKWNDWWKCELFARVTIISLLRSQVRFSEHLHCAIALPSFQCRGEVCWWGQTTETEKVRKLSLLSLQSRRRWLSRKGWRLLGGTNVRLIVGVCSALVALTISLLCGAMLGGFLIHFHCPISPMIAREDWIGAEGIMPRYSLEGSR